MFYALSATYPVKVLGPALCWIVLQCPAPEALGQTGMKHLAAAAWILAWWVTAVFPLAAVSLLSLPIYGLVDVMPPLPVWFSIMVIGAMLAQIIVNLAVVGLFIPITATLAVHYGLNPVVVCLTVGIICNVGILFPFSSVPVAAAMTGSEGYSSPRDYILYGLAVLVAGCFLALGCGLVLGGLVFPMPSV